MSSFGLLGYGYTGQRVNFNGNISNPTSFTLPRDPGGKQGVLVLFNNLPVDDDDYSLSGRVLTTTFPVTVNSRLKVIYLGLQAPIGIPAAPDVDWATIKNVPASVYQQNRSSLQMLLHPSNERFHRDIVAAGFRPSWFNQQWGGAQFGTEMIDPNTNIMYKFEPCTQSIDDDYSGITIANSGTVAYYAQAMVVSETTQLAAVWIKMYKVGNPLNNFQVAIFPDDGTGKATGSTPITNGTATSQNGRNHTGNLDGQWQRFVFPVPPTLVAGTKYHITTSSSGAIDSSNYWVWKSAFLTNQAYGTPQRYPFGLMSYANATPTWTAGPQIGCFMAEPVTRFLQPNGKFAGKLVFAQGTPINQSKGLITELKNFYDGRSFTSLYRVETPEKGKPIADFVYGIDHDRITLNCDASTGYASVKIYTTDGVVYTTTGTTDISTGFHDVGIVASTEGTTTDFVELWVDGVRQGVPVQGLALAMDPLLREDGTMHLGGGFLPAPGWTSSTIFTALPSTLGWTYSGTATESSAFSIINNKLCMNKNAIAGVQTAFYEKAGGFSNANGWVVSAKLKIPSNDSTFNASGTNASFLVSDGVKVVGLHFGSSFIQSGNPVDGAYEYTYQTDLKTKENVVTLLGKGSDYYVFLNGKLIIDGTGKLVKTNAQNKISFGDFSAGGNENSEEVWSYLKYYQPAMLVPPVSTGLQLSEFGYWSGNQSECFAPLYSSGSPVSIKKFVGADRNYLKDFPFVQQQFGVVPSPSTTSSTYASVPDMTIYALGDNFAVDANTTVTSVNVNTHNASIIVDGSRNGKEWLGMTGYVTVNTGWVAVIPFGGKLKRNFGLHKFDLGVTAGPTSTVVMDLRNLRVETK